jgi:hypothetical protein
LKSERLRQTFKKIETHSALLEGLEKQVSITDQSAESLQKVSELIKSYLKFADIIDDAQSVIKKEKSEESKKSEQSVQMFNILILYTQRIKIKASIDRLLLQARQLSTKLNIDQLFIPKSQQHQSNMRAQNIVRFYEKAIKAQKSLINLEKEVQGPSSDASGSALDPMALLQNEF